MGTRSGPRDATLLAPGDAARRVVYHDAWSPASHDATSDGERGARAACETAGPLGPHDTHYGMRELIIRDLNRFWITFGQHVVRP